MYEIFYLLHISCVVISVTGFVLRNYWRLTNNLLLKRKITRVTPHVVDTVLLMSAIGMVVTLQLNILQQPWLLAKIGALFLYIGLGMIALKTNRQNIQLMAFGAALMTVFYMIGVAINKSPISWLA